MRALYGCLARLLVASFLLIAGCASVWYAVSGRSQRLTREEAERLLRSGDFLAESSKTRLVLYRHPSGLPSDLIAAHRELEPFVARGWVEVRPSDVILGRPVGARFVLTADGERVAASGWRRTTDPMGDEAWLVPLALKELLEVRPGQTREQTADCTFIWRWEPTPFGRGMGAPEGAQTYVARFFRDGDEWKLVAGSEAPRGLP